MESIKLMRRLLIATVIFSLASCSSSQDEEDINAENNANTASNNENANPNKNNLGENVNNATDNEFVNNQGNMGKVGNAPPPMGNSANSLLTNNPSLNTPPPNDAPLNAAPPANQAAPTAEAVTPPPANAAAPATPPVTGYGPDGRGKVRYVRRFINKYTQPNGTGTPTGNLDQGDHPLVVKEEGSWNQLSNGTFVESQELSDEGIGRPRRPRVWQ